MKKLGLLIVVVSLIGAVPCFAQTKTKAKPSIQEQTGGEAKCDCQKSGKPQKVSKTPSGTLAGKTDEKAKEATGAMGGRAGEQVQKEEPKHH